MCDEDKLAIGLVRKRQATHTVLGSHRRSAHFNGEDAEPITNIKVNEHMSAIPNFTLHGRGASRVPHGDVLHGVDSVQRGDDGTWVSTRDSAS